MDKQKQIEEMTSIIERSCCNIKSLHRCDTSCEICMAQDLYACGYRKIDKNAVVLTRGDYEKLLDVRADVIIKDIDKVFKEEFEDTKRSMEKKIKPIYKAIETRTRKETAEKFRDILKSRLKAYLNEDLDFLMKWCECNSVIDEICKEITEGD